MRDDIKLAITIFSSHCTYIHTIARYLFADKEMVNTCS